MKQTQCAPRPNKKRSGFSLILSLAVMAMVLIMVISLTAFLTISLKSSDTYLKRAQARNNALLGAKIALGQLQLYVGPDRRVTASGMIMEPTGDPDVPGSQINPQWVGVWDTYTRSSNGLPTPYFGFIQDNSTEYMTDLRNVGGVYKRPTTQNWLVSMRTKDLNNNTFGPNTSTESTWIALLNYKNRAGVSQQVTVPYVATTDKDSNIEIGGFAYWTSDESQKARINTQDPYRKEQFPSKKAFNRILAPVFNNISRVKSVDFEGNSDNPYSNFGLDIVLDNLANVSDLKSTALLNFSALSADKKEVFLKNNFLDLSTSSASLLVNTIRGGFLSDMSAFLQKTGDIGDSGGLIGLSKKDSIIRNSNYKNSSPRFGAIKSWYNLDGMPSVASASSQLVSVKIPRNYDAGNEGKLPDLADFDYQPLTPVLTEALWSFNFARQKPENDEDLCKLYTYIYPKVSLWNPYNVTLRADTYIVKIYGPGFMSATVKTSTGQHDRRGMTSNDFFGDSGAAFVLFALDPIDIPPGEVVVFSAPSGYTPFNPGGVNMLSARADPTAGAFKHFTPWTIPNYTGKEADGGEDYGFLMEYSVPVGYYTGAILKKGDSATSQNIDKLETVQRLNISWGGSRLGDNAYWMNPGMAGANSGAPPLMDVETFESRWNDPPRVWIWGGRMLRINDDEGLVSAGGFTTREVLLSRPAVQVPYFNHNLRSPLPLRNPWAYFNDWFDNILTNLYIWPRAGVSLLKDFKNMPNNSKGYYRGSPFGKNGLWGNTVDSYVLFDVPFSDVPVASLGTFRNVMLSPFVWHPNHVIGNGNASIYSEPDKTLAYNLISKNSGGLWEGLFRTSTKAMAPLLHGLEEDRFLINDLSYMANKEIFDNYFLSTLVTEKETSSSWDGKTPLPNARLKKNYAKTNVEQELTRIKTNLDTMYHSSASVLINEGAFNVNSTSVEAWKAFLCSMLNVPRYLMTGKTVDNRNKVAFSKVLIPHDGSGTPAVLTSNAMWNGFHALQTGDEGLYSLDKLAKTIVEEVKIRGPFMSLSDFVNRRLIGSGATASNTATFVFNDMALRGTLDAAIRNAELNRFNYQTSPDSNDQIDKTDSGAVVQGKMKAYIQAMTDFQAEGAPGYLTQGEILQALAPAMTVRGDTFTIRSYGDYKNSFNGQIESRAYAEITVQRNPDYIDPTNDATEPASYLEDRLNDIATENTTLSPINRALGRKFVILSVRWISSTDL